MAKRHFTKSYSTPSELVQLLRSRGLEISNERKASKVFSDAYRKLLGN